MFYFKKEMEEKAKAQRKQQNAGPSIGQMPNYMGGVEE